MRKLKVLHLIHHLKTGGAELVAAGLVVSAQRRGLQSCSIGVLEPGGELETLVSANGVQLYRFDKQHGSRLALLSRLRSVVRALRPDVLHMHSFSAGLWGRLAIIGLHVPLRVITDHDEAGWINPVKHKIINRLLLPWTDRVVAVSEAVKKSLMRHDGIPVRKIAVVPNGIDLRLFSAGERSAYPDAGTAPALGMVARCSREKGGDVFIEALRILRQDRFAFTAIVAGDGPEKEAWKRLAEQHGLAQSVTFTGRLDREAVAPLLRGLALCVCPSREESFGLATIESMACGTPVIASTAGGLPELITHCVNGFLVPPENPAAIADAIVFMLKNRKTYETVRARAMAFVRSNYSLENTVDRYDRLYRLGRCGKK